MRSFLLMVAATGCIDEDKRSSSGDLGETGHTATGVDADGDGWVEGEDCDDGNDGVHPGADEICDEIDQDCDGTVDEDATDAPSWYLDSDGDGHGDATEESTACSQPEGLVDESDDCDDTDADVHPGAEEVCGDGIDQDCEPDPSGCRYAGIIDLADSDLRVGAEGSDQLGAAVSSVGDVNGDGLSDLIIGAPNFTSSQGGGFVVLGPPPAGSILRGEVDYILTGSRTASTAPSTGLGTSVAAAGDVDGDGYADLAMGADNGAAVVVFGGPSLSSHYLDEATDAFFHSSASSRDNHPTHVWGPGDLDGDGQADLLTQGDGVSERGVFIERGPVEAGRHYLGSGCKFLNDGSADSFAYFGASGASGASGDVDGDGFTDLLLPLSGGGAALLAGPFDCVELAADDAVATFPETYAPDFSGALAPLSASGDSNGDGYDDVLVASGEVGYFEGGPELTGMKYLGSADATWSGLSPSDEPGKYLAFADVDGDGKADMLVSSSLYGTTRAGAVHLLYGPFEGSASLAAADAAISGDTTGLSRCASAGDMDGDGDEEVLLGAPDEIDGSATGAAYLFPGVGE